MKCNTAWHKEISCAVNMANQKKTHDDKFDKLLKDSKFKKCPNCGVII
jgi:hypothetical protein